MKILSAAQIREWDAYTIANEPVSSIGLMDRAAAASFEWLMANGFRHRSFIVFCGPGNNGGDALALARLLHTSGCTVAIYVIHSSNYSADFMVQYERCTAILPVSLLKEEADMPALQGDHVLIEGLFGTGLNRPAEGLPAAIIAAVNRWGHQIISIDMPGGLFADTSSKGAVIVRADHTLSFQTCKMAFLMPENEAFTGFIHILDIGLHPDYLSGVRSRYEWVEKERIQALIKPRKQFSHKGNYGHVLLMAGSYGKTGAAVLAATGCLRAGAGLLTVCVPGSSYTILQTALPEAMALPDENEKVISRLPENLQQYAAIAIGPGIGTAPETVQVLENLLTNSKQPVILDADALNILASHQELFRFIPAQSILTPHPKEFERLFGTCNNDFEKTELAIRQAEKLQCIIVLKGHYTCIALADGTACFNSTGNAGMAKGGSGDVLTGILAGLSAQKYTATEAAVAGVYLHGLAGDLAAALFSEESMLPSDLISQLGNAFKQLKGLF